MEVPFLSSSAVSRAHYNLVQRVEAAPPHQVDDLLCQEVDRIQRRLENHRQTSSECVESLVLLLYCATTTLGRVTYAALEFAIPHAVALTEAGSTINQKRTGYLFCSEMMSPNGELQIMLVNTLRKDLENLDVARICLALDALIMNCPSDAIPAVTPRLIDLLSHDSPHVKRKTMATIRLVSFQNPDILRHAKDKVRLRLRDGDPNVAGSALRLLGALTEARLFKPEEALDYALDEIVPQMTAPNKTHQTALQLKLAEFIGNLADKLHESLSTTRVIERLHQMLAGAKDREIALILEIFRALSKYPVEVLSPYFSSRGATAQSVLGRLLVSPKPNIQYVCLACLLILDPVFWAGTTENIAAAFDEGQVSIIMSFLDSPESIIRIKTLQVLNRVDPHILSVHLSQLQSTFQSRSLQEQDRIAERFLEVAAELDFVGEAYACRVQEISIYLEARQKHDVKGKGKPMKSGASLVSERFVEKILLHLRSCSMEFCRDFVNTTTRIPVPDAGSTLTLVIAAAVCEYGGLSLTPQEDLLRGLATRLNTNPPAIQEALLLAMLRVTARCDSALPDVRDQVRMLHSVSRSHIRHRCEQYLTFAGDIETLKRIAGIAESDTLPDFLYALENFEKHPEVFRKLGHRSPAVTPRTHGAAGKLRYKAYDPPSLVPRLSRRPSSTASVHSNATSSRLGRSDSISTLYFSPSRHNFTGTPSEDSDDVLSRTLTAGDLALAAHGSTFVESPISKSRTKTEDRPGSTAPSPVVDNLMLKTDLITLDSPFLADPNETPECYDSFDSRRAWDSVNDGVTSRGWCGINPQQVIKRIEALSIYHVTPSRQEDGGEFLVIISSLELGRELRAMLRLIPGEEDSTLWQLRCSDATTKADLKGLLDDA